MKLKSQNNSDNQKENSSFQNQITQTDPMAAWFLGPKAEHGDIWVEMINYIFQDYIHWRRNYFPEDPIVVNRIKRRQHEFWFDKLTSEVDSVLNQLKSHFPFYSPRYIAHMLSEQTLPSVLGYFAGMLYNPNNVTDEAAPVTVPLELEVGKMVSEMLGYNPNTSWGHICSGGTIANTEALWVARTAQFNPLIVWEFCNKEKIDFFIKTPKCKIDEKVNIRDLSFAQLISLKPNESIFMIRKLAAFLINVLKREPVSQLENLTKFIQQSTFNINNKGITVIQKKIGLNPVIYVSESAHYCIKKAANILGYGEDSVKFVPVTDRFRMNTEILENMLMEQNANKYTACVIGIAGTTEEGAIDPIHSIKFVRDKLGKLKDKSFWIHVDAAWGGYIRSLFIHPELKNKKIKSKSNIQASINKNENQDQLDEICNLYINKLDINEEFKIKVKDKQLSVNTKIRWNDREVYKAFLAMPDGDSITIDPHKLGYIPYPCGIICFKNGLVTELITQKAQYISDDQGGIKNIDKPIEITAVGPYILEGSKPGAAAAAAWLAHKTIPLNSQGHGKIIRTSLLNTKKFSKYISTHKLNFKNIDEILFGKEKLSINPFTFKLVYDPADSNVVCFIAVPMKWKEGILDDVDYKLKALNIINEQLYKCMTIKNTGDTKKTPYSQEFFVSRTRIESCQYSTESVKGILAKFKISEKEYKQNGIFVLRSTIMNPWHYPATIAGKDYLMDFILALHTNTRNILNKELI